MLGTLSREEKMVLLATIKYMASPDGIISENDIDKINNMAEERGFDDFTHILAEVDKEVHSLDDLKAMIRKITNPGKRMIIIRYALEVSRADVFMNPHENEILKYLCEEWKIALQDVIDEWLNT